MDARMPASSGRTVGPPDICTNLYRVFCSRKNVTKDPTGFVRRDTEGEIEALRIYEEVMHANPELTSEQVDDELVKRIYTDERRKFVEGAYRYARVGIIKLIDSQPKSILVEKEKRKLKSILRKTVLQLPPPADVYGDEPDLLTKNDVYFERLKDGTRRLRVGGAFLLSVKSLFNMVFTIAHELGHSIDPCELLHEGMRPEAYDRLTACFRREKILSGPGKRAECSAGDQLPELFADWVAVQVTAGLLKKYATEFDKSQLLDAAINTVKDLCDEDENFKDVDFGSHPPPQIRIQSVFGTHPIIRQVLGCAPSVQTHCGYGWRPFAR